MRIRRADGRTYTFQEPFHAGGRHIELEVLREPPGLHYRRVSGGWVQIIDQWVEGDDGFEEVS